MAPHSYRSCGTFSCERKATVLSPDYPRVGVIDAISQLHGASAQSRRQNPPVIKGAASADPDPKSHALLLPLCFPLAGNTSKLHLRRRYAVSSSHNPSLRTGARPTAELKLYVGSHLFNCFALPTVVFPTPDSLMSDRGHVEKELKSSRRNEETGG